MTFPSLRFRCPFFAFFLNFYFFGFFYFLFFELHFFFVSFYFLFFFWLLAFYSLFECDVKLTQFLTYPGS
ncbi:hypothetical protein BDZ97DRAFT_1830766 [Flammula alnicola]|nr:hypothetical protein BDZ97DRAFT_1830766 [Flammula alnicola]